MQLCLSKESLHGGEGPEVTGHSNFKQNSGLLRGLTKTPPKDIWVQTSA